MREVSCLCVVGDHLQVTVEGPELPRYPSPLATVPGTLFQDAWSQSVLCGFFVVTGIKRGQKDIPLQKCVSQCFRGTVIKKTKREKERGRESKIRANNWQGEVV